MPQKSMQEIEGHNVERCPECGSDDIVRHEGEIYCNNCGAVIE